MADRKLLEAINDKFDVKHPRRNDRSDGYIGVSTNDYGKRLDDESWEEGTYLSVYKAIVAGEGRVTSKSYVQVGRFIGSPSVQRTLIPEEGFTEEQATTVNDMVKELELAKMSGQVPNLSPDLTKIYTPVSHDSFDD